MNEALLELKRNGWRAGGRAIQSRRPPRLLVAGAVAILEEEMMRQV